MDILKHYVDLFNENDEEVYKNDIDNAHAYEWMKDEVPIFECPDKDIERTYYFRYWTYRKHIKSTDDGYIITEFLPEVPWSGEYNSINAALGHHLYEGRWLKNAGRYLNDYIEFFLTVSKKNHKYSSWFIDAIYKYFKVTGAIKVDETLISKLVSYYEEWEKAHGLPCGAFWSIDNYDAMEFSISGTTPEKRVRKGIRPTLNSYMCADAKALSELAAIAGDNESCERYLKKHEKLKRFINDEMFEDGFFRAYHYDDGENTDTVTARHKGESPRELIGYIPFMFGIPEKGREKCFELLTDKTVFYTEYGLTTAEQGDPRFNYEEDHECLWNGYVWPFATSQTLTALKNVAQAEQGTHYLDMFASLLSQYARTHTRLREDGKTVPWIDEVRHPYVDDWSSRTILRDWGWRENKGGYERGKDYNHSTFCDLVISGICGVREDGERLYVTPCIPKDWDHFRLSGLCFRGKEYDIVYDKTGEKYGIGKGINIIEK